MTITLREVTPDDETLLREIYACTRAAELAMVPWSDEQREAFLRFQFNAQDSHYRSQFPEASYQLILKNSEPVGRLYVLRQATEIRVLDITVLPQYRNAGIGTSLIRDVLAEADRSGKTVTIWVEQFNPSQALFRRLGFAKIQDDGYSDLLEYVPAK